MTSVQNSLNMSLAWQKFVTFVVFSSFLRIFAISTTKARLNQMIYSGLACHICHVVIDRTVLIQDCTTILEIWNPNGNYLNFATANLITAESKFVNLKLWTFEIVNGFHTQRNCELSKPWIEVRSWQRNWIKNITEGVIPTTLELWFWNHDWLEAEVWEVTSEPYHLKPMNFPP